MLLLLLLLGHGVVAGHESHRPPFKVTFRLVGFMVRSLLSCLFDYGSPVLLISPLKAPNADRGALFKYLRECS